MSLNLTERQLLEAMQRETDAVAHNAELLLRMAQLLKDFPSDSLLAGHLVEEAKGDWKVAFEGVCAVRRLIDSQFRLLALTIAIEGKEREQQTQNKG